MYWDKGNLYLFLEQPLAVRVPTILKTNTSLTNHIYCSGNNMAVFKIQIYLITVSVTQCFYYLPVSSDCRLWHTRQTIFILFNDLHRTLPLELDNWNRTLVVLKISLLWQVWMFFSWFFRSHENITHGFYKRFKNRYTFFLFFFLNFPPQ